MKRNPSFSHKPFYLLDEGIYAPSYRTSFVKRGLKISMIAGMIGNYIGQSDCNISVFKHYLNKKYICQKQLSLCIDSRLYELNMTVIVFSCAVKTTKIRK